MNIDNNILVFNGPGVCPRFWGARASRPSVSASRDHELFSKVFRRDAETHARDPHTAGRLGVLPESEASARFL
jgi:hypothetical protein